MCAATMLAALSTASAKACSRFVAAEERANALQNVKEHAWAKHRQKAAIRAAEPW